MKTYACFIIHIDGIPGGAAAILGPSASPKDVAKATALGTVYLDLEEHDERIAQVAELLRTAGKNPSPSWYSEEYTEEEYQAAPLLWLYRWTNAGMHTAPEFGVTFDLSQACPACLTGIRQASPLVVDGTELLTANKHRVSSTPENDLLVRDTDVERLVASNVTGANFWPVMAKYKSGATGEIRWQQAVIENVLPPMALSTGLDETSKCSACHRGRASESTSTRTRRVTYRREDLTNLCDFNLSWEWFGPFGMLRKDELRPGLLNYVRPNPWILVTPKVMNLLRAQTKNEEKYQGCGFVPVWIEDDTHDKPYLLT